MNTKTTSFNQSLDKEKCITFLIRYGYYIHSDNDNTLIMKKSGTEFSTQGEKFPKKLTMRFNNEKTEVSLTYDTFVLFDTGDLKQELDVLSNRIENNLNQLV